MIIFILATTMGSICSCNTTVFFLALGFAFIYWLDILSTKKKSPNWWLKLRAPQ